MKALGFLGLRLLGMGCAVSILLSLLMDSGWFGDPASRMVGRHGDATDLGRAKVALGHWDSFAADGVTLNNTTSARRTIRMVDGVATVRNAQGDLLAEVSAHHTSVSDWCADEAFLHSGLELIPAPEVADRAPSGILVALAEHTLLSDPGLPARLGYAVQTPWLSRIIQPTLRMFRGEFGNSRSGRPVLEEIAQRAPRSLALAVPAFFLTLLLGLGTALWTLARGGWLERGAALASSVILSVSGLAWVMLGQALFAGSLGWFPVYGWQAPWVYHLILPLSLWVFVGWGGEWRFWKNLGQELQGEPFVHAARARGGSERFVLKKHVLPHLIPALVVRITEALPFLALGSLGKEEEQNILI